MDTIYLTPEQVADFKTRLNAKKETCAGVRKKHQDAYCDGIEAAKGVLMHYQNRDIEQAVDAMRRLLNIRQYLSSEKTESYQMAIRSAMSMVSELKK